MTKETLDEFYERILSLTSGLGKKKTYGLKSETEKKLAKQLVKKGRAFYSMNYDTISLYRPQLELTQEEDSKETQEKAKKTTIKQKK